MVVGSKGVGATATVVRYVCDNFYDYTCYYYGDYEEDEYRKMAQIDEVPAKMQIFDHINYDELTHERTMDEMIGQSRGFILMYSITSMTSFDEAKLLYRRIRRIKEEESYDIDYKERSSFDLVLIGNKCDLSDDRQVMIEEGKEFAQQLHVPFFETSAKWKINSSIIFEELVRQMRKSSEPVVIETTNCVSCNIM